MYEAQKGWTLQVLANKKLVTPYGMIYYWNSEMQRSGWITHTTEIYNAPVQGFATAEIIPIALIHAWHRLRDKQAFINLTVHDSIAGEIGPDMDRDEFRKIMTCAMTVDVYRFLKSCYSYEVAIPLGCGIKIGPSWGSGAEHTATVNPNDYSEVKWKVKQ